MCFKIFNKLKFEKSYPLSDYQFVDLYATNSISGEDKWHDHYDHMFVFDYKMIRMTRSLDDDNFKLVNIIYKLNGQKYIPYIYFTRTYIFGCDENKLDNCHITMVINDEKIINEKGCRQILLNRMELLEEIYRNIGPELFKMYLPSFYKYFVISSTKNANFIHNKNE